MNHHTPVTNRLPTRTWRFARLLLHICFGLIQSVSLPHVSVTRQRKIKQKWAAGFLKILHIRLHTSAAPPDTAQPVMLAANHISWLDICVLLTAYPVRFIAKSEIRRWPFIGKLVSNAGTLYVEREKRSDTARINQVIGDTLQTGGRVAVFPEGRTGDGTALGYFHASLLQPVINVSGLLCPVAIRYRNQAGAISQDAPYDASLLESLQRILQQPWIDVDLFFLDPVPAQARDRQDLARITGEAIARALCLPPPGQKESGKSFGPQDV